MLTKEQLIKRLTVGTLAYFEASPYAKAKKISSKEIKAAMEKLNSASTLGSIRLLFLADSSYEVISISGNMGMGKSMPEEEAASIAEKMFNRYVQGNDNGDSQKYPKEAAEIVASLQGAPTADPGADPAAIDVGTFAAPKKGQAKGKGKGKGKGKKNCNKGINCGGTCISAKKVCKKDNPTPAVKKAAKTKGKGTGGGGGGDTPGVKPLIDIDPIQPIDDTPQAKTTEYAKQWAGAWDDAPDDLKGAIAKLDQPDEIPTNPKSSAYWNNNMGDGIGGIHMGEYRVDGTGRDQAVWRHEYGHHMDNQLYRRAQSEGGKALDDRMKAAGFGDTEGFLAALKEGGEPASRARAFRDNLAREIGATSNFIPDLKAALGRAKAFDGQSSRFISASTRFHEAFRADEKLLLDRAARNKGYSVYDVAKADASFVTKKALAATLDKLDPGGKKNLGIENPKVRAEMLKRREALIKDDVAKIEKDSTLAGELARAMKAENIGLEDFPLIRSKLKINPKDPEAIAGMAELLFKKQGKNSDVLIQDLIGSTTKNKVGAGHDDAYYARDKYRSQNTEAFANLAAIYGSGHPLADKVLRDLHPNSYNEFKKILGEI